MKLYAVRLFNGKEWHTIRTYGTRSEAELFAQSVAARMGHQRGLG
jgi:hypothetical protein